MQDQIPLTIHETTSLGELIKALKPHEFDTAVQYDFAYLAPTTLASYRGYYDHLALGWTEDYRRAMPEATDYWPTVRDLVKRLEEGVGQFFDGWKGGGCQASLTTPIWAANPGHSGSTAIVGVDRVSGSVVIRTRCVE